MNTGTQHTSPGGGSAASRLLPIIATVFSSFLIIGMAMPVLPLHVHDGLGLGAFAVGLVTGAQFAASLVSRIWSGHFSDRRGAKQSVVVGLILSVVAGGLYALSLLYTSQPTLSAVILVIGRAVLGAGESFIITGAQSWGLQLCGHQNAGKVLAWMGTAMYAAFAIGAPLGSALFSLFGFISIALATALIPAATLLLVAPVQKVDPAHHHQSSSGLLVVLSKIWLPGLGLALSSAGFGAVTAFAAIFFASHSWTVWPAVTTFAFAFIAARLFLGHLADRIGGANVALVFVLIESAGLASTWLASTFELALLGVALTGFGYSLVYPAFGVEAIRRAPAQNRGLAMGAYTAFLDLALGFANPVLGLIGEKSGIASVFLISSVAVACATVIAIRLLVARSPQRIGTVTQAE